jgi:hypothetical protein
VNRDDIIRMAREAGYGDALSMIQSNELERFAALVAAAEREVTQKPVAWMHIEEGELIAFENDKNIAEQCEYCVPLYTAPPQREATQEPAAYMDMYGQVYSPHELNGELRIKYLMKMEDAPTPLYCAPPKREWQELTENEIKHLWYEACQTNLELTSQLIVHLARNIEAKLKEKNG